MGSKVHLKVNKYRLFVSNGFRADGKPNRASKTVIAESSRKADKLLYEFELEFCKKPPAIINKISFNDFIDVWRKRHLKKQSPNTINSENQVVECRLIPYFGSMKINKITEVHIEDFILELNQNGTNIKNPNQKISKGTIQNTYKILRGILNRAVEWKYINENPCDRLDVTKIPKPVYKKTEILQTEDLARFLKELFSLPDKPVNVKHQLFFYLCLIMGCRTGELLALTWKDIEWDSRRIVISKGVYSEGARTLVKSPKTEFSNRIIYIDDFTISLLERHRQYQEAYLSIKMMTNEEGYVFLKSRTENTELPARNSFNQWLKYFIAKHNLPDICVHGFRRMTASYASSKNVSISTIKDMLGHSRVSTTDRYIREILSDKKEGASIMSKTIQEMINQDK